MDDIKMDEIKGTPANVNILNVDDEKFGYDDAPREGEVAKHAIESDLVILSQDVDAVYDRAILLQESEVTDILEHCWAEHYDDPNFPAAVRSKIEYFLSGDSSTLENYELLFREMQIEAALIRFSSPYPEVRAVVKCVDDYDMPASTFRVWMLGTFWCGIGTFINQFFSIRTPAFTLSVNEVQLLSYPAGKFLEKVLPTKRFKLFGYNATLNPGPFNEKEHMLITIMANVGMFAPYTMNILIVQQLPIFYNQAWSADFGYQIITGLSIQLIGMGFAGMCRRFIVYPEHCIWLLNLAVIALNKSFHDTTNVVANGWKISRMKFFLICFCGMFAYFWLPGGIFQALSYFNWITWIAPNSIWLGAVFGQITGLGLNPLFPTLDWSQFGYNAPLIIPFFSTANQFIGTLIAAPLIIGFWYANIWDTGYFPMISNAIFDNTGARYNVTMILDDIGDLDHAKYTAYSEPYMAASNLILYGAFFAVYAALIVHTILYHRKEIANAFRLAYKSLRAGEKGNASFKDYHNVAMSRYAEVPEWAYLILTIFAIVLGCIALSVYPTHSSVSSIFFGIFLCIILVIPIGIITSITGVQITLNVFAEFIGGVIYPEQALAMNYFKSYGVMTTANALAFAQDLKLAHYIKIGQRYTFAVQIYGAIIATFVSTGILNYQMALPDVCTPHQKNHMICNGENTFFTATVFWGTLGPKRVFGANGIYTPLLYSFLIGAVLPIPFYFAGRKWPTSWLAKVHIPVVLYGFLIWGPYSTLANQWPAFVAAYIFQVYIKKRYLAWWSKYNYILSTAFSAGVSLCGLFIFAALSNSGLTPDWWGNDVYFAGCDGAGCANRDIPEVGYVGAEPGTGAWA